MPFVTNQGIRIHYEVEGEGSPLVLGHGVIRRLESWRQLGYADALRGEHRLILFDARGHGQSDKPQDPAAYQLKLMVSDVLAVLDDLGIDKAHYFGYSMGGRVGFHLAKHAPERFHSFILGGISPYRGEAEVKATGDVMEGFQLLLRDPEGYVGFREKLVGRSLTSQEKAQLLDNDAAALIAALQAHIDNPGLTDDDLSRMAMPCLVYCGDLDMRYTGARESVSHMPNVKFVTIHGMDHTPGFERSDLVLPHVKSFLAQVG